MDIPEDVMAESVKKYGKWKAYAKALKLLNSRYVEERRQGYRTPEELGLRLLEWLEIDIVRWHVSTPNEAARIKKRSATGWQSPDTAPPGERVLVLYQEQNVQRLRIRIGEFRSVGWCFDTFVVNHSKQDDQLEVVAWQPLPAIDDFQKEKEPQKKEDKNV